MNAVLANTVEASSCVTHSLSSLAHASAKSPRSPSGQRYCAPFINITCSIVMVFLLIQSKNAPQREESYCASRVQGKHGSWHPNFPPKTHAIQWNLEKDRGGISQ